MYNSQKRDGEWIEYLEMKCINENYIFSNNANYRYIVYSYLFCTIVTIFTNIVTPKHEMSIN